MKNSYPKPLSAGARPNLAGIPNPACPILQEARVVLEKTQDLHRAIRRLRRSTQRCITCPERTSCPSMSYFSQAIDTAIRELGHEWGLDRE
jgi:hypothetical protein